MNKTIPQTPSKINLLYYFYHFFIFVSVLLFYYKIFFLSDKTVYVDSVKVFNQFKGSIDAQKKYQSKEKRWQANIDTLTNEIKVSIQKYEKSLAAMSPKEQQLSKQLIQVKQKQLSDYQRGIQEDEKQENGKLTQTVVTEINTFLAKYGKSHNYKYILIANQSGTIAYAKEGLDITDQVISEMNSQYSSSGND